MSKKAKLVLKNPSKNNLQGYLSLLKEFQLDSYFETTVMAKAYELQFEIEVKISTPKQIIAMVSNRYIVELIHDGHEIQVSCECPYPLPCKHQAATILNLMSAKTTI